MFLIMSTHKKKFFKKVTKFEPKEGTKSASKQELKFAPLDSKGFATQPTYQQVKDALVVAIDGQIDDDLLDIRSCIELGVYEVSPEPAKARPTGMTDEEIKDSRERNKIFYENKVKKWDGCINNIEQNAITFQSQIWDKFTSKSMKDKLERLSNFSTTLSKNPVELLKAIKVQMHHTVRAQYSEWTRIMVMEKTFVFSPTGLVACRIHNPFRGNP